MRVENKKPASLASAGALQGEMRELYEPYGIFSDEQIKGTWEHELRHWYADEERTSKGGEFGIDAVIEVTDGVIIASYIAYYLPSGDRTPEEVMKMASAPGFTEMSNQDRNVYNAAWHSWTNRNREEIQKASVNKNPDESDISAPSVNQLIIIPRRDGEGEEDYEKRVQLVKDFGRVIDELSVEGEIAPGSEILSGNIFDFIESDWDKVVDAYNESLKELNSVPETIVDDDAVTETKNYDLDRHLNKTDNNRVKEIVGEIAKRAASGMIINTISTLVGLPPFLDYSYDELETAYDEFKNNRPTEGFREIKANHEDIFINPN